VSSKRHADGPPREAGDDNVAAALNRLSDTVSVDRERLRAILGPALQGDPPGASLLETHPTLLAPVPVFLSRGDVDRMLEIIEAVEAVVATDAYRQRALTGLSEPAHLNRGALGLFLGFDFHLSPDGPKLIEINTNPGGTLLGVYLGLAQDPCCGPIAKLVERADATAIESALVDVFREEFRREHAGGELRSVAIVDDDPPSQFLYPEMLLFVRLLERYGIRARIADPQKLALLEGRLLLDGEPIDLIYNRLTDFTLESPRNGVLRRALLEGAAVVTPGPRAHSLYANKRNLIVLTDEELLRSWNLEPGLIDVLTHGIPRTVRVTRENAEQLWSGRRELFFKPLSGYASRGTYRGGKLTRRVWQSIVDSDYVAQRRVPPSERQVPAGDGELRSLKLDVRCYVYAGRILLLGARLYHGQTTNLRTEGGGLASVLTTT
jgi:hypothetical protein